MRPPIALGFFLLLSAALGAQPRLVKDIDVRLMQVGSDPGGLATVGNITFFFAWREETGSELWKTDGTAAGTTLVRDIRPGAASGIRNRLITAPILGNRVFFIATDGEHGYEPWVSDGTAAGTMMLADITPGAGTSDPQLGPTVGSFVYFTATSPTTGTEVWRTDGTPAGTLLVKDLRPGASGLPPILLGAVGTWLLFSILGTFPAGLFITDGTPEGTIAIGGPSAFAGVSIGHAVVFSANGSGDIMATDGTAEGITILRKGFAGNTSLFTVAGGVAYFLAGDGVHGNEVWRSDGTVAGTYLLADLAPGSASLPIFALRPMGSRLWITVGGWEAQLWTSDGTAEGTRLVKNARSIEGGCASGSGYYFGARDDAHGLELWKSDGTAEGTVLVKDIAEGPADSINSYLIPRPGGIFFTADDGIHGREPWVTYETAAGSAAGTHMVENVASSAGVGSFPSKLAAAGGKLVFRASDGSSFSIWTSDGTTAGTLPVELPAGSERPSGEGVGDGALYYFVAGSVPAGPELWRTDGTTEGTIRLFRSARPIEGLVPFDGGLLFAGDDGGHGSEPWVTDGTPAGTRMIADIVPGTGGSFGSSSSLGSTRGATIAGDSAYFSATGPDGAQPWRTDGTAAGTRRIVTPNAADSKSPTAFTRVGERVYFAAELSINAFNLWRTEIATGESVLVKHFVGPGAPQFMWDVGGTLLFTLRGELWRSDGSEAGTTKVADGINVPDCGDATGFARGEGVLFWFAYTLFSTPELWRSDGTAAGTYRLGSFEGEFAQSLQHCLPAYLHSHDGKVYFIGKDDLHGAEPWVSDGTLAGTHLLSDVNPGAASSDPGAFVTLGNTLFFRASLPDTGSELWALCLEECAIRRRAVRR